MEVNVPPKTSDITTDEPYNEGNNVISLASKKAMKALMEELALPEGAKPN